MDGYPAAFDAQVDIVREYVGQLGCGIQGRFSLPPLLMQWEKISLMHASAWSARLTKRNKSAPVMRGLSRSIFLFPTDSQLTVRAEIILP